MRSIEMIRVSPEQAFQALRGQALDTYGATALSLALIPIAGSMIPIETRGNAKVLVPNDQQAEKISSWILEQLKTEPENDFEGIHFESANIWPKVVFRKWWPWVLGIAGIGFIAGRATK